MKTEVFTRKDGTEGKNYIPEINDKVVANYNKVRTSKAGAYENHSLGVKFNDEEIFIKITNGQKKSLDAHEEALKDKTLEFVEYTNNFGKQVGVRVL